MDNITIGLIIIGIVIVTYGMYVTRIPQTPKWNESYRTTLESHEKERIFPYRYFKDETGRMIPLVAVTAFFRDERAMKLFDEYLENGIQIIGITSYKSFPKAVWDGTADENNAK